MTVLAKLVAKETDSLNYTTYVFECLEDYMIEKTKYIMCVRYPNWDARVIELEDVGYLEFREVLAGVDKWFDGNKMVYYNYDDIQFIKFIPKVEKKDYEYIIK